MDVYKWALTSAVPASSTTTAPKFARMTTPPLDGWALAGWEHPIANGEYQFRTLLPAVFARTEHPIIQTIPLPPEPDAETRNRLIDILCDWSFTSISLTPVEVYHCACLMFESALTIPELQPLPIMADLRRFLHTLRFLYPTNPYHNYAHAVDVLQAVYAFLEPDVLPPLALLKQPLSQRANTPRTHSSEGISAPWRADPLTPGDAFYGLKPIEVLALLVAAVGHDVGHPGITAQCLGNARAPLCSLAYQSPLETLHTTLLSQTLRAHSLGFLLSNPDTEELIRSVIMSTDMQLHAHYMGRFSRELTVTRVGGAAGSGREGYLQKVLLCQAVLHVADISNPVRPFPSGVRWSTALIQEWTSQARLESLLRLPPTQAVWPEGRTLEYHLKQARGQVQFLDFATLPLVRVLVGVLPKMQYFLSLGLENRKIWEERASILGQLAEHNPPNMRMPTPLYPEDRYPYPEHS